MDGVGCVRGFSVSVLLASLVVSPHVFSETSLPALNTPVTDLPASHVRVLRGWNQVPPGFDALALRLHQQGVDILEFDINRLQNFLDADSAALSVLSADEQALLQALLQRLIQHQAPAAAPVAELAFTPPWRVELPATRDHLSSTHAQILHPVDVTGFGTLIVEVEAEPGLNFRVDLFDQGDGRLLTWHSAGQESLRRVEQADLASGRYAVQVRRTGGEGEVEIRPVWLQVSVPYDQEENDTVEQAQTAAPNQKVSGVLGYRSAESFDTLDWFQLRTDAYGELEVQLELEPSLNARLDLYANQGQHLLGWDSSGQAVTRTVTRTDLAPGEYQIRLQRTSGQGAYLLTPIFTPSAYPPDTEPNDSVEQAQLLMLQQPQTGLLGYTTGTQMDGIDWYCLQQTDFGTLTVRAELETTLNARLDLYDASETLLTWDSSGQPSVREVQRADLAPGRYCLRVQRMAGHGGYRVEASLEVNAHMADQEPNDTPEQALLLAWDAPQTGLLGYVSLRQMDTYDWYRFELEQDAALHLSSVSEPTLNLRLDLYAENASRLLAWDSSGQTTERNIERPELGAGTYFVRVQRVSGQGGYTLLLRSQTHD